ncbi:MAG: ESPR-type extended signal peptide-containing protein, partial [Burkholderia sp.]
MNKTYRVVWNASTGTWCAVAETARSRTKATSSKKRAALAAALVMASMGTAVAAPGDLADEPSSELRKGDTDQKDDTLGSEAKAREDKDARELVRQREEAARQSRLVTASLDNPAMSRSAPRAVSDPVPYVQIDAAGDGSDGASVGGTHSIAIGSSASAAASARGEGGGIAIGGNARVQGNNLAFGASASATGSNTAGAIAVGGSANASGNGSVAIGNEAAAEKWGGIALGSKAISSGESAFALGEAAEASEDGAMAMGQYASAGAEGALALGASANASATSSVALGAYSEADRDDVVSVGSAGYTRQVVNVGAGTEDTDAVNVEQLKGVATALGGNASIGEDGSVVKPSYTIDGASYDNVGDALVAASKLGGSGNAVEYDSEAKDAVTLGGAGKPAVTLSNVKAGALSATSTDAVNGAQLYSTNTRMKTVEDTLGDAGLVDPETGDALAVAYDTSDRAKVSLKGGKTGTTIANVKAGALTAASMEAVNGAQLYQTNQNVSDLKDSLDQGGMFDPKTGDSLAIVYDGSEKDKVSLAGGRKGTTLTNLKAGTVAANSSDAVTGGQLFETREDLGALKDSLADSGLYDPDTETALGVAYDSSKKDKVTLAGTGAGTIITNLRAGAVSATSKDAVNGAQLYNTATSVATALGGDAAVAADGTISKPEYKVGDKTYDNIGDALTAAADSGGSGGADSNALQYDDASHATVTLGGKGASKAVAIKNLAEGVDDADAVNVGQMKSGIADARKEIEDGLADGSMEMKYIKMRSTGTKATVAGDNAVAIGSGSNAGEDKAVAIGTGARAMGINSVAVGAGSFAKEADTFAVGGTGGKRRIVNVADGKDVSDAVTMGQLQKAFSSAGTKMRDMMAMQPRDVETGEGQHFVVEGRWRPSNASVNLADPKMSTSMAFGVAASASGGDTVALGIRAMALSDFTTAVGVGATTGAEAAEAVSIGRNTAADGVQSVVVGVGAAAGGLHSAAFGADAYALADEALALGSNAKTEEGAVSSIAIGRNAHVMDDVSNATAFGKDSLIDRGADGSMAFGMNAKVVKNTKDALALGNNAVADRANTISVGSSTLKRQIVNVANATQANDATNLSQLKGVVDAIGGDAAFDADGKLTAPSYKIGDKTYDNVGDALAAAATGTSDPNGVAYDNDKHDAITLSGTDGTKLTNLKDGDLSAKSKDAVTGAQLYATNQDVGSLKDSLQSGGLLDPDTGKSLGVVYDSIAKDKVTLGADGKGAILTDVLAGAIAAGSKDAINGGQLFDTATSVASALGGASKVDADGKLSKPAYTIGDTTYDNVGDALTAAAKSGSGGGTDPDAVQYDDAKHTTVSLGGKNASKRVSLKNLEAGVDDTDAVNVGQMNTGLSDMKSEIRDELSDGSMEMKYIKVKSTGTASRVTGDNGVAIGGNANVSGRAGVAIGTGSRAAGVNSVALGANSVARADNTFSVGDTGNLRRIVNVANGSDDTDAVNMRQLHDAISAASTNVRSMRGISVRSSIPGEGETQPGEYITHAGEWHESVASLNLAPVLDHTALVVGTSSEASGGNTLAVGIQAVALSDGAVAVGVGSSIGDGYTDAVAMGRWATSNGIEAVALGTNTVATSNRTVAVGTNNTWALGEDAVALGSSAQAMTGAVNSVAIGAYSRVNEEVINAIAMGPKAVVGSGADGAIAIGSNANVAKKAINGIALGSNSIADRGNALSLGTATIQRQIINVARGTQSNDAVNLAQLKDFVGVIGGSAEIGADGKLKAPSFEIGGKSYNNVGDAIAAAASEGGGGSTPNAVVYEDDTHETVKLAGTDGTTLSNVKAGEADMDAVNVSQLKSSGLIGDDGKAVTAVTYDSDAKDSVTLAGADGTKLTNLKAGDLSATSKDAVTGSQLYATNEDLGDLKSSLKDGGVIDPTTGESLAVVYDSKTKDSVKLAGADGTTLSNVKAGEADMDAVNVSQLKSSGLIGDDGKAHAAVTYDSDAKDSVTLAGKGGTTLANVKAGEADMDAVNVSQLKSSGLIGDDGKAIAAVTYDSDVKDLVTLAGKDGTKLTNLKAGDLSATSKDAVTGSQLYATNEDLGDLKGSLKDGGVIDPTTGES